MLRVKSKHVIDASLDALEHGRTTSTQAVLWPGSPNAQK